MAQYRLQPAELLADRFANAANWTAQATPQSSTLGPDEESLEAPIHTMQTALLGFT